MIGARRAKITLKYGQCVGSAKITLKYVWCVGIGVVLVLVVKLVSVSGNNSKAGDDSSSFGLQLKLGWCFCEPFSKFLDSPLG